MRFEISDSTVLKLIGLGAAGHAVGFALNPKAAHRFHYSESVAYDVVPAQTCALALSGMAAQTLSVAYASNSSAKKSALKVSGMYCLASAGLLAYHAHKGKAGQNRKPVYGAADVALATLCLWKGFSKGEAWQCRC